MATNLEKALGRPDLVNVLALDGVVPAAGSVIAWDTDLTPVNKTQATLSPGLTATATQDVGAVGAGAVATFDVTVTGAVAGQCCLVAPPATLDAGLICFAFVSAADTVTVRVFNGTAAPIDPASGSWRVRVIPN